MEVLVTSLDALLHKATNANLERPDAAALEAFCAVLADSPNGPYIATRVIASRIRSPHPTEALLALEVLDACMKRCDVVFHTEVDKFRFLNEMIKLVSPKYYGNKTAPAVRQKVLMLMHNWTIDYPRELKIKDAYEMLKKQGVVKNFPPPAPVEEATTTAKAKSKDGIFADEEKSKVLQKLLQSKNPEDLQAANRLIKTMVREGERRVEAVTKLATEVQTVNNNVRLLDEMLEQYRPDKSSPDDLELIKELYLECHRLRPTVFKLAAETQQNDDMLNEIIDVSDELGRVLDKYSIIILHSKSQSNVTNQADSTLVNGNNSSLLDFASPSQIASQSSTSQASKPNNSNLEVLGDIFSSVSSANETIESSSVNSVPVLKPVSLMSSSLGIETSTNLKSNDQTINKGLEELNALGKELLKSSLPSSFKSTAQFNSQRSEKLPMNLLVQAKLSNNPIKEENLSEVQNNPNDLLDLDYLISKTLHSEGKSHIQNSSNDDAMVDITPEENFVDSKFKFTHDESDVSLIEYIKSLNTKDEAASSKYIVDSSEKISETQIEEIKTPTAETPKTNKPCDIKPLTDINISLESIKPGCGPPLTIFEESDGITIVLHFAENKPRSDVYVVVVSITSRNAQPITDFKFQAVVPKGCKARLLQASENSFPAFSPFLPPAAITQVMLIARPLVENPPDVFLKFVITYICQDDTVSEIGEIKSLPLNDNL